VEFGREWYRPGLVQGGKIPFFTPQGQQEIDLSATVIPKAQNVFGIGWTIPIINVQALAGLQIADLAESSVTLVHQAKKDEAALNLAQDLFRYEALVTAETLQKKLFQNMQKRTQTISSRKTAGLASGIELSTARATEEQSKVSYLQSSGEKQRFVLEFQSKTGLKLQENGYGMPSFPLKSTDPFNPAALKALQKASEIQLKNAEVVQASVYPTLGLELGYKGQYFVDSPKPQTFVAIRAQFDILDGGTRVRTRTQAMEPMWDLLEKKKELEQKLLPSYESLMPRHLNAEKIVASAQESQAAAKQLLSQVESSFAAGVVKFAEVRDAEEGFLRSEMGRVQAQLALQAIHLESMFLTGHMTE
jgi:outer membrane protein TolC